MSNDQQGVGAAGHRRAEAILAAEGKHDYTDEQYLEAYERTEAVSAETVRAAAIARVFARTPLDQPIYGDEILAEEKNLEAELGVGRSEPVVLDPGTVAAGRALLAGRAIEHQAHKVLARRGITSPRYEEKVSALDEPRLTLASQGLVYDQEVKRQ